MLVVVCILYKARLPIEIHCRNKAILHFRFPAHLFNVLTKLVYCNRCKMKRLRLCLFTWCLNVSFYSFFSHSAPSMPSTWLLFARCTFLLLCCGFAWTQCISCIFHVQFEHLRKSQFNLLCRSNTKYRQLPEVTESSIFSVIVFFLMLI